MKYLDIYFKIYTNFKYIEYLFFYIITGKNYIFFIYSLKQNNFFKIRQTILICLKC